MAGEQGVNRDVSNVYFMEVPDIYDYIDRQGILLSTLFPIADNPDLIEELIPKLVNKEMAGLAVKPARYLDDIPEILIHEAQKHEFPLIALPVDANLSELSNGILELLLDKNTTALKFRNTLHEQMMAQLAEGAGLGELIETLAGMMNRPAVLLNHRLEVLGRAQYEQTEVIKPDDFAVFFEKTCLSPQQLAKVMLKVDGESFGIDAFHYQPIHVGEECLGYLLLERQGAEETEDLRVALEQTALLMASVFQREKAVERQEQNYLDSFIRDVLNEQLSSQDEVIQKAKVFKWDLAFPMIVMNIDFFIDDPRQKREWIQAFIESGTVEQQVNRYLQTGTNSIKLIYMDDSMYVFLNVPFERRAEQRLKAMSSDLLNTIFHQCRTGIGISSTAETIERLPEAYREARQTVKITKKIEQRSFASFFKDLGVFELFDHVADQTVLAEFKERKIGAVLAYDEKKEMELFQTLEAYIACNLNSRQTAKELFVHYNTLRNRLVKLRELGVELDSGFDIMEVALACRIHMLRS